MNKVLWPFSKHFTIDPRDRCTRHFASIDFEKKGDQSRCTGRKQSWRSWASSAHKSTHINGETPKTDQNLEHSERTPSLGFFSAKSLPTSPKRADKRWIWVDRIISGETNMDPTETELVPSTRCPVSIKEDANFQHFLLALNFDTKLRSIKLNI